ncbi:hypothetical protein M3G04_01500 [Dietzia cinnamea]|uniref:hypothetical protein n=1 Tax=Dietzia cinnamea TaxID=321318 RepID=UPI00223BA0A7|nr:hypothetical protein [Dietzia cinnamea]MCT2299584.1 hypothetical protein [Dietzia cinnamea]
MRRQAAVVAATGAAVIALAGCSGGGADDEAAVGATTAPLQTSTQAAQQSPGMDGTPLPEPTPVPGDDREAVELAVEKFTIHWACYRTFAQQPQREWFDSWSGLATEEFVQQQRISFTDSWSWAWNTETQAIGCQRRGDMQVAEVNESTSIARITVERHLFHADARADEGRVESKTYDVAVETDGRRVPLVLGAQEVDTQAPFPPRLSSLSP